MSKQKYMIIGRFDLLKPFTRESTDSWRKWLAASIILLILCGFIPLESWPAKTFFSLAILGTALLLVDQLIRSRPSRRLLIVGVFLLLISVVAAVGMRTQLRYHISPVMDLRVQEYSNAEYPEDPSDRSVHYGKYNDRKLVLAQKDATHFDFVLEPQNSHIAKITFRDVDISLMTPSIPDWTKQDGGLQRIALTDRQWNRQQVQFQPGSPNLEIFGGDGFEQTNLFTAELAKNCLNAGLWEILLFVNDGSGKKLYYQNWFNFPLGHYKTIFEHNTGLPYWRHWYYLEHWFDPTGTVVPMAKLRQVMQEDEVPVNFNPSERVIAVGEQLRKRRTTLAKNIITWGDYLDLQHEIRFATFVPPGRYSVKRPWNNQYARMKHLQKAILRTIDSPAIDKSLHELELRFSDAQHETVTRFLVSGFDLNALPRLPVQDYPKGLYMPMGIGVPPFFQSYDALRQAPPHKSPYASLLLDDTNRWIDHHSFAIDGPVLHLDDKDPNLLHLYLMSYERHSLIGHFVISIPAQFQPMLSHDGNLAEKLS